MRVSGLRQVKLYSILSITERAFHRKNTLLPMHNQLQQLRNSRYLSEAVCLRDQPLSPSLVDALAVAKRDWIGLLQDDWEIDPSSFRLPGIKPGATRQNMEYFTINDLFYLTQNFERSPVSISKRTQWVYTLCLQVIGLGRVRVVIISDSSQLTEEYRILATNRLDWSPRTILSQWVQQYPSNCSKRELQGRQNLNTQKFISVLRCTN
ncbi:hypothetical protein IFO70_31700 [Phormidium tenue FACHB-886]|nr:hypothetical protein [Phormidium tenue FACHB-886]